MPPSDRASALQPAAQQEAEDDVVERTPSHPVTTTLILSTTGALILAIGLTGSELGRYINQATKSQLSLYKKTAVQLTEEKFAPEDGAPSEEAEPTRTRRRAAAPADAPADVPAETPAAPAADAPPAGEK